MAKIKRKVPQGLKKISEVREKISLELPKEMSIPSDRLQDYSILLYGEKKIGKTSLASQFRKTFFLMLEPGGKALSIFQKPVKSWEEFKGYVRLIEKDKTFDTVVVDPIDVLYKLCMGYVCTKKAIEHPSDEGYGKGWEAIRDEFTPEMNRLLHLGKGIILISHASEKDIKTRTGGEYSKIMPTMSGQARDILEGVVDIWAYYAYDGEKRVLIVNGDDHIGAGHRLKGRFLYASGEPIREIPMGNSEEEAYENFIKAFNNELRKEVTVAPKRKLIIKRKG